MRRALVLALSAALGVGCSPRDEADADPPRQTGAQPLTIRHDLDLLRRHITLPDAIRVGAWVAVPRGKPSVVPGPTDLMLLARFPMSDEAWASLRPRLGEAGPARTIAIDPRLRPVLPASATTVEGPVYGVEPFLNIRWGGGWAVWTGEALVVQLFSR